MQGARKDLRGAGAAPIDQHCQGPAGLWQALVQGHMLRSRVQ